MPMAFGLLNGGAPFGPILSFIVASPLLNPIIIGMVTAFLGIKAAGVYFAITFSSAVIFGVLVGDSGRKYFKNQKISDCSCDSEENDEDAEKIPQNFVGKFKVAVQTSWENFRAIIPYLLIGIGVGAFIHGLAPQETIARLAGPQNPFAIPIAAVIGIPLYIRAESAIPIGIALMSKGMSVGAVMAFIIGGAGMAIPEMSLLLGFFKPKLVAMIVVIIYLTAVIGGYAFNLVI